MQKIEEMTRGAAHIGPASLYTTLKKLDGAGFIRLLSEDDAKKIYGITEAGLRALRVEIDKRERYAGYGKEAMKEMREENNA